MINDASLSMDQIRGLVETHLLQLEYGGSLPSPETTISSIYSVVRDMQVQFGQIQLPRTSVVSLKKKWLAFLLGGALYLMDCDYWLRITGDMDEFLTLELKDLLCIHNSNRISRELMVVMNNKGAVVATPKSGDNNMNIPVEMMMTTTTTTPPRSKTPYQPFTVTHFLENILAWAHEHSEGDYARRLQTWCDYALIGHHFSGNPVERNRLCTKLLKGHDRFEESRADDMKSYWYASFGLLYHLIQGHINNSAAAASTTAHTFQDTQLFYECVHDINFPMYREFVMWEVFLFTHNVECDMIDRMTGVMNAHLKWYDENCRHYSIPRPLWFKYYLLEDNPRLFWLISNASASASSSKTGYLVRFEWLDDILLMVQELQLTEQQYPFKVVQGRVWLSEHLFRTLFMPNLYKQILLDTIRLLYMLHVKDPEAPLFYRECHTPLYTALDRLPFYGELPALGKPRNLLFDYSLSHGMPHTPVMRRLVKIEEEREEREELERASRKTKVVSRPPFREVVQWLPDIEDLAQNLPPCLKNIAGVKHLNNDDRWTVIPYFVDMGYKEAATVGKLSLEPNDVTSLESQYKYQVRHNASPKGRDPCSLHCSALINLKPDRTHTIACPYEVAKRGSPNAPRKGNYSSEETRDMRFKCAASINLDASRKEYINHPIDYVQYKIERAFEKDNRTFI